MWVRVTANASHTPPASSRPAAKLSVDYSVPHVTLKSVVSLTAAPKARGRGFWVLYGQACHGLGPARSSGLVLPQHARFTRSPAAQRRPRPHPSELWLCSDLPQVDVAATTGVEGVTVGGEVSYDTAKSAITKVGAGAAVSEPVALGSTVGSVEALRW